MAIVVVLITIGLFFALVYFSGNKDSTSRQEFIHSELAHKFLMTFFKTTTSTDCKGLTFTDLYKDCARSIAEEGDIQCIDSGGNAQGSCEFIRGITASALENVLEYKVYGFEATTPTKELVMINPDPAQRCTSWKSKVYGIPLNPGTIVIKLKICE
ncbi:MAG: hypothetical protein ABIC95_04745 [archaeon]